MNIVTTYKTNANGASQIVAKGHGRQVTTPYDPALSSDRNHGNAAGNFFNKQAANIVADPVDLPAIRARLAANIERVQHTTNDSGTKHTFIL